MSACIEEAVAWLEANSSARFREGLARYGIAGETASRAIGVSMSDVQRLAKTIGRNHEFASELWATGGYEQRMLACFVADPKQLTAAQMDRWCRDFDNWAICDTACFKLFDKTPLAWRKVEQWSQRKAEFEKRAAFALLASLALHDKAAADQRFIAGLTLIEHAAGDDRNFVKKGVNWALRGIGRRNVVLREAAIELAERMADSAVPATRWIARDALREFAKVKAKQM